jgi:hypothetical protein
VTPSWVKEAATACQLLPEALADVRVPWRLPLAATAAEVVPPSCGPHAAIALLTTLWCPCLAFPRFPATAWAGHPLQATPGVAISAPSP